MDKFEEKLKHDKITMNNENNPNLKEPEENSRQMENLREFGVNDLPQSDKSIYTMNIIGQIEGHMIAAPQNKSTKYEHIIPQLVAVEEDPKIKGLLVILNTMGGDVEAGLAIAELIGSLSKPTVTLVIGGGHSIGVPLATAGDYSFIAPTATMTIHPIRMNGLVIGIPQTFRYFLKMQERIINFVLRTSNVERETFTSLMNATDELANDVGTILIGEEAVHHGLIDEVGGLNSAISKLKDLIRENE
ncbi:ClpP family protease [Alkaliphilus oremlandii]|uniref:Peptidase S14 ClpP n=1 Tax=Alkaliphilus oremlandii (strain OhILAs) TaxID=350688 RepID=A8MFB8_ALKOO|nr:ATP-dependent Clp protease proteolytic subunit [Alkaliphilus oremlandii]ABW19081.1 peptidase S14 ClpP [Alkaliphilus oremlandii OhILAs]